MLTIVRLDRHQKKDRQRFINLAYIIYKDDPDWVAPLEMVEHIKLSNKEPFYDRGEAQLFIAVRDGRDVGRIAAIENRAHNEFHRDKTGFFGFFECENKQETATALLKAAEQWLEGHGLTICRGPVNLSTNHTVGLLVDGEPGPPMADMTYNPAYYLELITGAGYKKEKDVVAHKMNINSPSTIDRLEKMASKVKRKNNVTTRMINMKKFHDEVKILKRIYNSAWEKNWGFVPMTDKEFDHVAEDLKMVADPGLIRFVMVDGVEVGFIGVVLNINEILLNVKGKLFPLGLFKILLGKPKIKTVRLLLLGTIKEYRQKGLEALLYYEDMKYAIERKLDFCENSWLLEDNHMVIKASEYMGGQEYRRYRIFDKAVK